MGDYRKYIVYIVLSLGNEKMYFCCHDEKTNNKKGAMNTRVLGMAGCFCLVMGFISCSGTEEREVVSPDKHLKVVMTELDKEEYGDVAFAVYCNGEQALPLVNLGMETNRQKYAGNLKFKKVSEEKLIVDDYRMPTGKRSHCVNQATQRVYSFENEDGHVLEVTIRTYDDGVAFKYGMKAVGPEESVVDEHTAYEIPQGAKRWMQQYTSGYEGFYPLSTDGRLEGRPDANLWGYPGLVELRDSVFMLMTEANIRRGHGGSFLCNADSADRYQVRLFDKRQPMKGAWESPWRVLIMGALSDVVESTLVTDVSDPSKVEDTSWIKPASASWIYWAHNHGTKDYQLLKEYIDLAANMKWPYTLIDWEWNQMGNGGNLEDAVKYARERGIKPLLWYNSSTSWLGPTPLYRLNEPEDREKEFAWLNKLGVVGVKVDFFAGDSISSMDYYIDLLEDAAKYKLMVNFHGAAIPRGWQRTYPNLMSVEAVYGAEWYNNNNVLTRRAAAHNATLPFTRNVVGPMDYTPGTFSDSQHPHITTHAHELALPVIFESALQHMPDRPSVYYGLPERARQLLSALPTAWDDTKLLSGYPGIDVVLARRKGNVWYIAGINGTDEAKEIDVPLEVLALEKDHKVTWFQDGNDGKSFVTEENVSLPEDGKMLKVNCLPRGGFVAVVHLSGKESGEIHLKAEAEGLESAVFRLNTEE